MKEKQLARLSASFFGVVRAAGCRAGVELWPTIALAGGRDGASIQRSTVERWAAAGLVAIRTRAPRKGEHHLAVPIVSVRLTRAGAARARARRDREMARARKAA